jgi:hypothetical protein
MVALALVQQLQGREFFMLAAVAVELIAVARYMD